MSGLVVIDLDAGKGTPPARGALPDLPDLPTPDGVTDGADILAWRAELARGRLELDTLTVSTPGGGTHLYYRQPARKVGSSAGQLGWSVDVRGHGGYVVAPRVVTDAGEYRITHYAEPAALPVWLADLLTRREPGQGGPYRARSLTTRARTPASRRYVAAAVRAELEWVATARPGTRNNTLNKAAFALGQFVGAGLLDERATFDALVDAAMHAGLPAREAERTTRSGLRSGMLRPRQIGGAA